MKIRLIIIIDSQTMLLVRTALFLSPFLCCEGVSKIPSKQAASLEVLEDGNIVSDEGENIDDDGINHVYGKESKHHIYGKRHYRDGNQVHVVKTSLKSSMNKNTDNEDTDRYTDSNNMSSDLEGVVRNTIGTPTDPVRVIHKDRKTIGSSAEPVRVIHKDRNTIGTPTDPVKVIHKDRNTIGTPTDPVRVIHKSSEDSIETILPTTSKSPNAINDTTETLNARNGRTETSNARNGRTEDSKAEEHSTGKLLLYIILCLTGIVVLLLVMLCVSKGSGSRGDSPGGDE